MSENKYQTPILQALAQHGTSTWSWPDALPGLGPKRVVALSRCADCPADAPARAYTTWAAYGETPLCRMDAMRRAQATP